MTSRDTRAERDRLLAHDYDGIEEYDNPLPGWWVWLFWATIAFSGVYVAVYHAGPGASVIAEYEEEVRLAAEREARQIAADGTVTEEVLAVLEKNLPAMAKARETFVQRCAACHGDRGQGIIGPNLTDDYWLHGGKLTDIYRTIREGVPDKGMVPWKGQLQPAELSSMAAFVGTLHGSNPPNAKPPQGVNAAGQPAPGARAGS
ncbi:MAG: c-type cytochrome [Candidatus Rokubacteria bacterium]|nr:c-type cytochrome [Candidatus Rokubacteria bacterium]